MAGRHHGTQVQVAARYDAQRRRNVEIVAQSQICLAGRHWVGDGLERQDAHADMDARMRIQDVLQEAREDVARGELAYLPLQDFQVRPVTLRLAVRARGTLDAFRSLVVEELRKALPLWQSTWQAAPRDVAQAAP